MDINPIRLLEISKIASERFLNNGVPLNEAIAKLAEENELTPMQIHRIAEDANHRVQAGMYKKAEDKSFTFDLANAEEIIQQVRGDQGMSKVAALRVYDAFGRKVEESDSEFIKTAAAAYSDVPEVARNRFREVELTLEKIGQHISIFRKDVIDGLIGVRGDIEDGLNKLAQYAKEHVFGNKGKLGDLLKFACLYDPDFSDGWQVIFEAVREELKKIASPVEKEMLAEGLEMPGSELDVINGKHTMAIDLDTLKNKISEEDRLSKRLRLLDTFGDAVVDRIRSLRTVGEADDSILEDTWMLNKKAEAGADEFIEYIEKEGVLGKALLALLGLGAAKAIGETAKSGVKGAIKEVGRKRSERRQLKHLTGDWRFAYA